MRYILILHLLVAAFIPSKRIIAQDAHMGEVFYIIEHGTDTSQLVRTDSSGNVIQTIFELEQVSIKTAGELLSSEEIIAVETVFGDSANKLLSRQLQQSLNRVWSLGQHELLIETLYTGCDVANQRVCFGYSEYGRLSSDSVYTPITAIDFHGESHRNGQCVYQEILVSHDVELHQESGLVSISVRPPSSCLRDTGNVYTLVFNTTEPQIPPPEKIQEAVGYSATGSRSAYYLLKCESYICEVVLTLQDTVEREVISISLQTAPLSIGTLLDTIWLDDETLFYQQFISEPQASYQYFTFDIGNDVTTRLFSDYTLWRQIYLLHDQLIGFSGSSFIAAFPLEIIYEDVYQVIDVGEGHLIYTEDQNCIDTFKLLQPDLSIQQFNAPTLFQMHGCIRDIALDR